MTTNQESSEKDYRHEILNSPSAQRNKDPIWNVLKDCLTSSSMNEDRQYRILEVAAGTGVHTLYFANKVVEEFSSASCTWYPTDPDDEARASITGRIQLHNDDDNNNSSKNRRLVIRTPQCLTLNQDGPIETTSDFLGNENQMDLMICINMIHISPWEATIGLFQLASKQLKAGGILYLYGPYKVCGKTAPTNMAFDNSLKSRDPSWGIRNLEDVIEVGKQHGFKFDKMVEMPVNNWSVLFVHDCK